MASAERIEYTPLRRRCTNSPENPCTISSHRHEFDPYPAQRELAEVWPFATHAYYASLFGAENLFYLLEARATAPPMDVSGHEQHVQDLFTIFTAYFGEYAEAMKSASLEMYVIRGTREKNTQRENTQLLYVYTTAELDETFDTARENVRAKFTSVRDVIASELANEIIFYSQKCIDARLLRNSARAVLPLAMKHIFEQYMRHADDREMLDDIILCLNTQRM